MEILMTPQTPEQKITGTVEKLTEELGGYFLEKAQDKFEAIRSVHTNWFDDLVGTLVSEFQKNTSVECAEILSQYDVNKKGALVQEANQTLRRRKSWRPSGDPEKDIKAHILPLNKSYLEDLRSYSKELDLEVDKCSKELTKLRQILVDEFAEFQSVAKKLQKLTGSTEKTTPCFLGYDEST
ncbi:unnamed protein product [Heterobilharzia americana]|nr:unnamed protein product [Heterobilharzia americana]